MFRFRNLVGIGIAVAMLILMTSWAAAQPVLQGTATPEPGTSPVETPVPTVAATDTPMPTATATAVAPAVTPQATPVGTPSTLPKTGGSDDGTAAMSLLLVGAGAVILIGALGLALSRRSR